MAVGLVFEGDEEKRAERAKSADAHLDALLGPRPEEPKEEPAAAAPPEPEKPAPAVAEPERVAAKGPEAEGERPVEIDDPAAREKKRADGLQRELAELRKKNQELLYERQRREMERQAPSPVREAAAPPTEPPKRRGLPVTVDENEVFVPEDVALQLAEQAAERVFERRSKPTPEQIAQAETQRAVNEFISAAPHHQEVAEQVVSAGQMIELAIQNRQLQAGPFMSLEHSIDYLEQSGVAQQIAEYFPAVGEHLREFVEAFGSREVGWKRSVLHQIARSAQRMAPPAEGGMPAPAVPATPPPPRLAKVNAPTPIAKMGGSRALPESDLEREFNRLLKAYTDDPFIAQSDYKRLQALGKQLGKPNF